MKSIIRFRGFNGQEAWRGLVERLLAGLQDLASISQAEVVLEKQAEAKPPFRVGVSLAIPGPDIHASVAGHTLQAAILKAIESVKRQILGRNLKRAARHKSRKHGGPVAIPWSGNRVAQRA
jgi:ribosome-associated translation inhibitor RaiA